VQGSLSDWFLNPFEFLIQVKYSGGFGKAFGWIIG